jgi:hypothetical protein
MTMQNKIITTDLSKFGYREIALAIELLESLLIDNDSDFSEGLNIFFNMDSGYVFLADNEYNAYMINKETKKLEQWHNLPDSGIEGFLSDLLNEKDLSAEDTEYLNNINDK